MNDAVLIRLRALLGTAGVEQDANSLPRALPESGDALALVCRLAHDEGWKMRVEGCGTWLAAERAFREAHPWRAGRPNHP